LPVFDAFGGLRLFDGLGRERREQRVTVRDDAGVMVAQSTQAGLMRIE